jgi:hypothetical protein
LLVPRAPPLHAVRDTVIRRIALSPAVLWILLGSTATAAAQTATTPGQPQAIATIYSVGIEWPLAGDTNHNATASVSYRVQGATAWNVALPLVRVDYNGANTLAGSVLFLTPGTAYDISLSLSDPDGGTAQQTLAVTTRALPLPPLGGRTLHVTPGSGGGDGSQANPFKGIAAAQAAAQPGDTLLLHAGDYGGRVALSKPGTAANYIVWKAYGDGEVLFDGVDISGSHVWVEGITVRNQPYGLAALSNPDDVVLRRSAFYNNHYSVLMEEGGRNWYIADNTIVGDTPYYTESLDGEGIELNSTGGHTVAHNSITNVADGISDPGANTDLFGNDIFDTSDDGIEADNGGANVRMWRNRIHNAVHNGISFQPQAGAPWYIVRNQIVGNVEAAFKFRQTDRFVLLHNTIVNWGNAWPGTSMMCCNEDHLLRAISRNNLWISIQGGQIWGFDAGIVDWRTDLDYDGMDWGTSTEAFAYGGVTYQDIPSLTAASGLEAHGVRVARNSCFAAFDVPNPPPAPVPPQAMTLRGDCVAVDKGAALPNVDDGEVTGAAPDLGAYEYGREVPVYGPRAVPTATVTVLPSTITSGGSATLSWSTTDASTVYIDRIGGVAATGSASLSPATTTTYTLTATGASGVATASTTLTVSAGSTPYGGTPVSLPGTIEAERFDDGGPEVAYHDGTAGNSGGAFRTTDVDLEATSDSGGGYDVGWVGTGEWLNYTVTVASSGTYTLSARVASIGTGGTFHLEAGGTNITGPIAIPDTGWWQAWTTVSKNITLTAGRQILRLVMDSVATSGAVGNFNWIRVSAASGGGSTPYGGVPAPVPGTIEGERFDEGGAEVAYHDDSTGNSGGAFRSTDVDIEAASDTGSGYDVGWIGAGEWLKYTVSVGASGSYTFAFRVANTADGARFHFEANGIDVTGPLSVPNTGGWQNWSTVTKTGVPLSAGTQVLRLVMDTAASNGAVGNINWIAVTAGSGGSTPFGGTPVSLPGTIEAERFDEGGAEVAYHDDSAGNSGGAFRTSDVDIEATADAGGGYDVGWVGAGEWLKYTVTVTAARTYTLSVRVASIAAGGTFHVEAGGVNLTGPISVPNTGGWQSWTTVSRSVSLAAGTQVLRIVMDTAAGSGAVGNFNWISVQ